MPSRLPSVMVRITAEQDRLLTELGRLQSRSKASFLRELLDGAEPLYSALERHMRAHTATIEGQPVAVRDAVASILTGAYGADSADLFASIEQIADKHEDAARTGPQRKRGPDRTAPAAARPSPKRQAARK